RPLQHQLGLIQAMSHDLDWPVPLSPALSTALRDWSHHATVQAPLPCLDRRVCLTTDASFLNWGAHLDDLQACGPWSPDELLHNINVKELLAVRNALRLWASSRLRDSSVLLQIDNVSVLRWIRTFGTQVNPV